MKQSSRGSVAIAPPSFLLAGIGFVMALMMYAPFAYAEEVTTTSASSTVTVAPEKLEKELKAFVEKGTNMRDKRAVAMKIKQVERRIAELKKHIERYEGLLKRLKAVEGTATSTRKGDDKRMEMKDKMKDVASSTRTKKSSGDVLGVMVAQVAPTPGAVCNGCSPVSHPRPPVVGSSTPPQRPVASLVPVIPVCRLTFEKLWFTVGQSVKIMWNTTGASFVEFIGQDADLPLPVERQSKSGTVTVTPTLSGGLEQVTLRATSETGHSSLCSRTINILPANASASDKRLAPLYAQLTQGQKQIEKLMVSRSNIDESIAKLNTNLGVIHSRILAVTDLGSGPVRPTTTVSSDVKVGFEGFDSTFTAMDENSTNGKFTLSFEVVAVGDDVYIPKTTGYTMANKTVGVNYRIDAATGTVLARNASAALDSTADIEGDKYVVQEGKAETFTLTVAYDPTTTGMYRVQLLQMNWGTSPSTAPTQTRLFTPYASYRTAWSNINGN